MSNILLKQLTVVIKVSNVYKVTALRALSTTTTTRNTGAASASSAGGTANAKHYDIIIGGGGLVGTALAAAVAKNKTLADKRVLLLEGAPEFKGFKNDEPYSNRVSAINHNSIKLFEKIGVWDAMKAARVKAVKQMQVWDAYSDAEIKFHHEQWAEDVAYIIENNLMLHAFYSLLKEPSEAPNVEVRNLARIKEVQLCKQTQKQYSQVTLQDGETFTCDLLVGADGANSMVRQQMAVDVYSMNYERSGLVATVQLTEAGDNSVAWQRFLPTGPVAMLPLNETTSSIVWSTTNAKAKELCALPAEQFVAALNEAFLREYTKDSLVVKAVSGLNSLFGQLDHHQYPPCIAAVQEKSRATFPLGFLHASSYVCTGAALIGDAAHRIHPLAGQGVNLGYSDVSFLVETLAEAAYAGAKLGDKQYLIKYEQQSLTKNVPILIGVHGLHTLYSTTFSPVVMLRSLGLQFTQNVPFIKNIFMKRAMG